MAESGDAVRWTHSHDAGTLAALYIHGERGDSIYWRNDRLVTPDHVAQVEARAAEAVARGARFLSLYESDLASLVAHGGSRAG